MFRTHQLLLFLSTEPMVLLEESIQRQKSGGKSRYRIGGLLLTYSTKLFVVEAVEGQFLRMPRI